MPTRSLAPGASRPRTTVRLVGWLGLWLASPPAHATVPEAYGTGVRHMARGGGGVAHVRDGAAAFMNPAGLWGVRRPEVSAGLTAALFKLDAPPPVWWDTNRDGTVDERDAPLSLEGQLQNPWGIHASLARHVGHRFGIGATLYLPTQRLFRLKTFEPSLPTYLMHDNRPHRYVLALGVGGQVLPGVAIGAAIDIVPKVKFNVDLTGDIHVQDASEDTKSADELVGEVEIDLHQIELDIVPGVAPVIGLQLDVGQWFEPLDGLTFGATWRGEIGVPIDARLDVQANLTTEDVGDLDPYTAAAIVDARLAIYDHYVPMRVDVGASYHWQDTLLVYADARWTRWTGLLLSVANLGQTDITSPLFDVEDAVTDGNATQLTLRDTWELRAGGEMQLPRFEFANRLRYLQLTLRAGGGWHPTPLLAQGLDTAILDTNRWSLTGGGGLSFWDPLALVDGPVHVDLMFQLHQLVRGRLDRATDVPLAGYPVDQDYVDAGGSIVVLGAEFGFQY